MYARKKNKNKTKDHGKMKSEQKKNKCELFFHAKKNKDTNKKHEGDLIPPQHKEIQCLFSNSFFASCCVCAFEFINRVYICYA